MTGIRYVVLTMLLVTLVISAGCLGGTPEGTVTLPDKTITVTKTVTDTTTTTKYLTNSSTVKTLEANLSECAGKIKTLEKALNSTKENLNELRMRYEECLAEGNSKKGQEGTEYGFSVLEDREYYLNLIRAIDGARSEIYVMMFLMKYDPYDSYDPANDLIRALVKAEQRGVRVHVLLEDGIEENRKAYDYLKQNGVDVTFDSPATTLHAKVVVIDGKTVFIGSHNWSEAALDWNHEVSVRIDSEEFARGMMEYFLRVRG